MRDLCENKACQWYDESIYDHCSGGDEDENPLAEFCTNKAPSPASVQSADDDYQEVSPVVWQTPSRVAAESAFRDMIDAGEHGPKAQTKMIDTLEEHFKAYAGAQRQIGREEAEKAMSTRLEGYELEADRFLREKVATEKRYSALVEAANKARIWIRTIICQCESGTGIKCARCVLVDNLVKALSDLDTKPSAPQERNVNNGR